MCAAPLAIVTVMFDKDHDKMSRTATLELGPVPGLCTRCMTFASAAELAHHDAPQHQSSCKTCKTVHGAKCGSDDMSTVFVATYLEEWRHMLLL